MEKFVTVGNQMFNVDRIESIEFSEEELRVSITVIGGDTYNTAFTTYEYFEECQNYLKNTLEI